RIVLRARRDLYETSPSQIPASGRGCCRAAVRVTDCTGASSSRLPARSADRIDRPVALPPGRARLATRLFPTGSPAVANTIGMTDVACSKAITAGVPDVRMTSTLSRTNSAAISAKRSSRPSAQRYSIVIVRPSYQPTSRSRCTKGATHSLAAERVLWPKKPMVGSFPRCCARAAQRGHPPGGRLSGVVTSWHDDGRVAHPLLLRWLGLRPAVWHVDHGCERSCCSLSRASTSGTSLDGTRGRQRIDTNQGRRWSLALCPDEIGSNTMPL